MDAERRTRAYSPPPSQYTGDGKVNVVASDPSSDRTTSSGSRIHSPNGRISCVGKPVWSVLTCKVTGNWFVSLAWK